ncbi:aldose 1-epimerase [Maribacter sp. 2304DJ31-5]|uniref:aldose epimerase family protein n=1 Tax=Maribacter sp. 2304DJ31-5 TaxID=3386273 RepID=UPI0039BC9A44
MIQLEFKNQKVKVDAGELVGYQVDGHEFIHQKGSPGWRSSDTEMFPVIGPTNNADFRVQTPKGKAVQDQHGLLREMEYHLVEQTGTKAVFRKKYTKDTPVTNSKYPDKSTAEALFWPYDFEFSKMFELKEEGLEITFEINAGMDMPFMLGYHPAFKLHAQDAKVSVKEREISIPQVMAVGHRAMQIPDHNVIVLKDKKDLKISTEGFGHFMLWTEVPNMVCIEPITFYPYTVAQENLHNGFEKLNDDNNTFQVVLTPQ